MIHFRQVKKGDETFVAEKKGQIIGRVLNKKDGFTQWYLIELYLA